MPIFVKNRFRKELVNNGKNIHVQLNTCRISSFLVNPKSHLACVPVLNGILHSVDQTVIFRGEHCEVVYVYFDYTENTAFCSLRELKNSNVRHTVIASLLALVQPGSPLGMISICFPLNSFFELRFREEGQGYGNVIVARVRVQHMFRSRGRKTKP